MTYSTWYVITDVNPEPWAIGPLGVTRRNNKAIPYVGPNQQLVVFKKAVAEALAEFNPTLIDGPVALEFFFWRRMDQYKTAQARTARKNEADATNLQKALEDALQGILITNDRNVHSISSTVVEQSLTTIPRIVIKVSTWNGFDPDTIPDFVWVHVDRQADTVGLF